MRRAGHPPRRPSPTRRSSRRPSIGSIFRSYNALLDEFAGRDDLEALVLVHQDAEIVEPELLRDRARCAAATPRSGWSGASAPIGVRSIAWWEASVTLRLVHQPLRGARRRRPAVVLVGVVGGAGVRPDRRGRDARRLPDRRCRRGSSATSASTSLWASFTATTSTSACRSGTPAARS